MGRANPGSRIRTRARNAVNAPLGVYPTAFGRTGSGNGGQIAPDPKSPSDRRSARCCPCVGGFGLKFDCTVEPFAAILARKTDRKVALVNSREEEILTCLCRENAEIRIRSATTPAGEIAGRETAVLMDCGAYRVVQDVARSAQPDPGQRRPGPRLRIARENHPQRRRRDRSGELREPSDPAG